LKKVSFELSCYNVVKSQSLTRILLKRISTSLQDVTKSIKLNNSVKSIKLTLNRTTVLTYF